MCQSLSDLDLDVNFLSLQFKAFLTHFIILGDIGQWNPNGTLKIIDRKKHIFKLSQGEYIVPEKIENIYIKSQFVEQVFVHGESLKVRSKIFSFTFEKAQRFVFSFQSCVVAIVVPDVEVVKQWATENNIPGTLTVLCNNQEVKHLILNDMISYGKEFGLKSFEQVGVKAFSCSKRNF